MTTDRDQVRAVLAKPPKLAEGTHIYDALSAAVAQVEGRRSAPRASSCSPTATTSAASRAATLRSSSSRSRTSASTRSASSPGPSARRTPKRIADDTGGEYAAATSPDDLTEVYEELGFRLGNEYLLRYKSGAAPDENVDVSITVDGYADPVSFSYTTPSTGTAAPYKRRSRTS